MRKVLLAIACLVGSVFLVWLTPASESQSRETDPRTRYFTFSCQLEIEDLPARSRDLEIWIPFPSSDEHQQITGYRVSPELSYEMYADPVYHNQIIHFTLSDKYRNESSSTLNSMSFAQKTELSSFMNGSPS